jgi:hypothetical protein
MITFKTEEAHSAFHSMTEGMWEIARDDNVSPNGDAGPTAALYERLIGETAYEDGAVYPRTYVLSSAIVPIAQAVIDNMDDNERLDLDDPETYAGGVHNIELHGIADGNPSATVRAPVVDRRGPEMLTREALEEAVLALTIRAAETDTASPEGHRARLAIEHIQRMLDQCGLDEFKNGDDGTLPDFCDVVIYG